MKRLLPYVAVIIDSFHSALSSRILWIAFFAIWLLLGALAPIGYREDYTTTFVDRDLDNASRLKAMLAQGLADSSKTNQPVGRIARALPEDLKRQLRQVGEGEDVRIWYSTLSDALNELFDDDSWYDAQAWQSTVRLRELRVLDESLDGQLSDSQRKRQTRLRIEAALPGVFEGRSARSIRMTYAGFDFPARLAIDKTQFLIVLNQMVFPTIIKWLLGYILVFLGILVTASIVPDMLQPGSLHLLLSKPISRWMLLISKFIGGCAFVCLCVVQLVVGLYFIAGLRLDVWNARLLLSIPVFVFVFAVFYSVSVFAGLRWRSPILAIGVTCIFAVFCIVIGWVGGLFDAFVSRPDSIKTVALSGDQVFVTTRGEGLLRWQEETSQWEEIFESEAIGSDRVLPPVTLNDGSIATAHVDGGRMNVFGMGAFDLLVLSEANQWRPQPSLRLPTATTRLLVGADDIVAANTSDIAITSQRKVKQAIDPDSKAASDKTKAKPDWMAKLSNMMGVPTEGFENLLPSSIVLSPPRTLAIDSSGNRLALLSGKQLYLLERRPEVEPSWTITASKTLAGELPRIASLAINQSHLLLATEKNELMLFANGSLTDPVSIEIPNDLTPLLVISLDDARRFAVLTSDQRCRILSHSDATSEWDWQKTLPNSKIETIGFDPRTQRFVLAHHVDRIDVLDSQTLSPRRQLRPQLSTWRKVSRYLITPLRTITPQTGEVGGTIAAIISGESAVTMHRDGSGPAEQIRYKILSPILSCGIFIIAMISLSCYYFTRRDF
ncbi:ABC-2 family transporter protein [Planctomycetes bacterium CA13]|uniref:ABC-2 family transporter protein n=1 Tax=Novipirellula herctigrandis TaxID=2527986 RepID=A0A5C5YP30_9BACT|nr:ABC-2 family transporter protein [Planctomycetes bacterium CA13]